MFKFFTVVILVASTLLACRPDPGQQHDIPREMVREIKQVDQKTLKLPDNFRDYFTDYYKDKSVLITSNTYSKSRQTLVMDLKDKIILQKKYQEGLTPHQIQSFDEKFAQLKGMYEKTTFIEGQIRAGINEDQIDTSQEAEENIFEVSLIKYDDSYFGVIELPGDEVLLLYGDRMQVSEFKQNFSLEESKKIHKYQALFTESFNEAYEGKGLLFILGSYMAQRYFFQKNFHILLELNDLVYKGADLFLEDLSTENSDESRIQSMRRLQEFSSNVSRYNEKSFSVLYTDQPLLAQLSAGSPQTLGAAYVGQSCVVQYKALWAKPFMNRDSENKINYGQYILDAHEFSHMFGANHVYEAGNFLMKENINPLKTQIEYVLGENIELVRKSKGRVNQFGNCSATNFRGKPLPVMPLLPSHDDAIDPHICGPKYKAN